MKTYPVIKGGIRVHVVPNFTFQYGPTTISASMIFYFNHQATSLVLLQSLFTRSMLVSNMIGHTILSFDMCGRKSVGSQKPGWAQLCGSYTVKQKLWYAVFISCWISSTINLHNSLVRYNPLFKTLARANQQELSNNQS